MYKTIELLMVEDNPDDIRLTQEAFKEYKVSNHLSIVKDSVEALSFLRNRGEHALATLPDVILISLRVLWQNNAELLKQIKHDASLVHIPVVILTTFEGEEAILGDDSPINLCVSKPLNWDCLIAIVKHIGDFGLTIARAKSVSNHNRPELSLNEISRVFTFQHTQTDQDQLQNWDNEGGRVEYDSV